MEQRSGDALRNYRTRRKNIQNGDILLFRGHRIFSRMIRFFSGSEYSHAGLAVWWNRRLMVMEVLSSGLILRTMSRSVSRYFGHVDLFSTKKSLPAAKRQKMIEFAQEELGKKYSVAHLLQAGVYRIFGLGSPDERTLRRVEKMICSEFISRVYLKAGIDLKKGMESSFTTPGDISLSPALMKKSRLK